MAAVVARGALRGLAAAPRGRAARPRGAAAAFIVRRGASMGLVAARPPPASQRCARATRKALSTAAPEAAKEDDGYAWVPHAVLAGHRRPGLLVLARVDGPRQPQRAH